MELFSALDLCISCISGNCASAKQILFCMWRVSEAVVPRCY